MIDSSDPTRAFQGYHKNASANSKKVVTDAFKVGMSFFFFCCARSLCLLIFMTPLSWCSYDKIES